MHVLGTVGVFFILFFSITVLGKVLWFFALFLVPNDASFELSKSTFRKNSDFSLPK